MVVRAAAQGPVEFAISLLDGQVVDPCMAHVHQSVRIKLPVLVENSRLNISGLVCLYVEILAHISRCGLAVKLLPDSISISIRLSLRPSSRNPWSQWRGGHEVMKSWIPPDQVRGRLLKSGMTALLRWKWKWKWKWNDTNNINSPELKKGNQNDSRTRRHPYSARPASRI